MAHVTVLLRVENAFEAYIARSRAISVLLMLGNREVALIGRCTGEDKYQAADKSLEEQVRAAKSDPSTFEGVAVIQAVKVPFQIRVLAAQVTQRLVLVFNGLNL